MPVFINVNGTNKIAETKINVNGTWKPVSMVWVNVSGVWKQVASDFKFSIAAPAYIWYWDDNENYFEITWNNTVIYSQYLSSSDPEPTEPIIVGGFRYERGTLMAVNGQEDYWSIKRVAV